MKSLRGIGTIATGAIMLGAALSGAVSAGLDTTGLTKDFFYDADYNPMVQIVVGEKGMATDAVAAGNIAATVGNLAYATKSTEVGVSGEAAGQVTIGVSALGATGKFKQNAASLSTLSTAFYDDNIGLTFHTDAPRYQPGEFISYSLACDTQQRAESGILQEATYNNVHCLFCATLCLTSLENPSHDFEESIFVDYSNMTWYEYGLYRDDAESLVLKLQKKTVDYIVDTDDIPMSLIGDDAASAVDFEWRGKFILFGEEYYVKDIKSNDEIYLAKGKVLDDISSEGYTSEYLGYKFKIDHLIYSAEFQVAGILLDIEKPDGTVVQAQVSKMANGIVDDIEIAGIYAEEADQVATASLIVYDTTSNVKLEHGKDLEYGGEVKKYWRVSRDYTGTRSAALATTATDISEYQGEKGIVLHNVSVEYRHSIELEEGEALEFPSTYRIVFDGFRTSDFTAAACSGEGEGNIKVEKDGKYQLLLSFTDNGGNRWNDVRLDQGPISQGDYFLMGGKIYEYYDAYEKEGNTTRLYVVLKDLLEGGKEEYPIDALTSPTLFYLRTTSFTEAATNDDYVRIEPDSVAADSDVYNGSILGVRALYDAGDIYWDVYPTAPASRNWTIGVSPAQLRGGNASNSGTYLDDFERVGNNVYLDVIAENLTSGYYGETGTDLNDYTASRTGSASTGKRDTDDILLVVWNPQGEYVVVDLYDRDFNESRFVYYSESVKATASDIRGGVPLNTSRPEIAVLNDDRDTLLILPDGGDYVTVDYGGDYDIEGVSICHPQEAVDATIFIGTSEEATVLESVITEADVGTTKTAGCCTYTVEEFSVTGSGATASALQTTVKAVPSNLVVPEISADTTKNLIIVGGPAVNSMTTVTADEIAAASNKYIVKKDGKKLVVAGWTAADTVDAGNALISWLKSNVH